MKRLRKENIFQQVHYFNFDFDGLSKISSIKCCLIASLLKKKCLLKLKNHNKKNNVLTIIRWEKNDYNNC
jgi:hypothetical protein